MNVTWSVVLVFIILFASSMALQTTYQEGFEDIAFPVKPESEVFTSAPAVAVSSSFLGWKSWWKQHQSNDQSVQQFITPISDKLHEPLLWDGIRPLQ